MPDQHYVNPRLAEIYDLDSPWSLDRDFYLSLASGFTELNILDLGCGTGLLCDAYAERGHHVTGVDPSGSMLEVARRKPHGESIEWVKSSAQNFVSDKLYDLIIMTGHAFQVLLEDSEVSETFVMMRNRLKPTGLAVFESRNPAFDWKSCWNYDLELELSTGEIVLESRHFLAMQDDRMKFELLYQFSDETLVSLSELRFLSFERISEILSASGLYAQNVFGDWGGGQFSQETSEEMIFSCGLAQSCL